MRNILTEVRLKKKKQHWFKDGISVGFLWNKRWKWRQTLLGDVLHKGVCRWQQLSEEVGSEDLLLIYKLLKDTRLKLNIYKNTKKSDAFPEVFVEKGKVFRYSDVEIFTSKTFTRSLMVQLVWINIIEAFTERPFWKVEPFCCRFMIALRKSTKI